MHHAVVGVGKLIPISFIGLVAADDMVIRTEDGEDVVLVFFQVFGLFLFPRIYSQVIDNLFADGFCFLQHKSIQVDLKLIVQLLALIDHIEYLPGEVPADLLFSALHLGNFLFGHILMDLVVPFRVVAVELDVEFPQLFAALGLHLFDDA